MSNYNYECHPMPKMSVPLFQHLCNGGKVRVGVAETIHFGFCNSLQAEEWAMFEDDNLLFTRYIINK